MFGDTGIVFPFIPTIIPPPIHIVPPRRTLGQIFTLDTVQGYLLGDMPIINQPWNMVLHLGPGVTSGRALLTFHRPDGSLHLGDSNFAFIGPPTIGQRRINDETGGQYIVYTFAAGELNQIGRWTVSVILNNYYSQTWSFPVLPIAPDP
jgi:hypothetical protein